MSNFEKFTVTGVNVTKANKGSYSLSLGAFVADNQKTTGAVSYTHLRFLPAEVPTSARKRSRPNWRNN